MDSDGFDRFFGGLLKKLMADFQASGIDLSVKPGQEKQFLVKISHKGPSPEIEFTELPPNLEIKVDFPGRKGVSINGLDSAMMPKQSGIGPTSKTELEVVEFVEQIVSPHSITAIFKVNCPEEDVKVKVSEDEVLVQVPKHDFAKKLVFEKKVDRKTASAKFKNGFLEVSAKVV